MITETCLPLLLSPLISSLPVDASCILLKLVYSREKFSIGTPPVFLDGRGLQEPRYNQLSDICI